MKNTKRISRLLCLLLAMATIVGCTVAFASCKNEKTPDETQSNVQNNANTAEPGSEEELYRPGDIDFEDYDFKLLVTENSFGQAVFLYDSDETPREVCDYALWSRQALMEVELTNEKEEFTLPPFIRVLREVTDDPDYSNYSLARIVPPEEN